MVATVEGSAGPAKGVDSHTSTTPGLVVAATASGTGKTTIATGLMRALSRTRRVAPFKVGPDYIDPGYHGLAAGRAGRNLDSFMCGSDLIAPLYAHGSAGADIAIVEGVMGLFDGRIGQDPFRAEGSTAEVASLLGLPVILVVDARHMSQSAAAIVHGFATMDKDVHIAGVIVNQLGSPRHADIIQRAIEAIGVPVLGAIPRVTDIEVPSRHLGLITTAEHGGDVDSIIESMADLVSKYIDCDAVAALASPARPTCPWNPHRSLADVGMSAPARCTVGIAAGPAFTFTYAEHRELLQAAGAHVVEFDPLSESVPDVDGLIIPGGFPEEHAGELAQRRDVIRDIRQLVTDGAVIHGECAGLLWLLDSLSEHPMCGVIPGAARMARLSLGYRDAVAVSDSSLAAVGQRVRGHEFHKTSLIAGSVEKAVAAGWKPAWGWRDWQGKPVQEGFVSESGRVHASYLHVHPAGSPAIVANFIKACTG